MNNYLAIPELNPVHFFRKARALADDQYNMKHRDEWPERETWKAWQGYGKYFQKWQTNDTIRLQFMSNVAPITLQVYDCKGRAIGDPLVFTQVRENRYIPGLFIYEASLALTDLDPGRYRLEVTIGDPVSETLESDWIDVAALWADSSLIEYTSSRYYGDAIFATGYAPSFRIEAWLKPLSPSSKDSIYEDQSLNQRMVFSDPFQVDELIIGPASGAPHWTPAKMTWILGCEEVYIDGKAITKAKEGSGDIWDEIEVPNYPLKGYSIHVRETNRRSSRIFPIDPSTGGKKVLVALNVETEGFADTSTGASSNVIEITSVE
jgi:hypothetical protein